MSLFDFLEATCQESKTDYMKKLQEQRKLKRRIEKVTMSDVDSRLKSTNKI